MGRTWLTKNHDFQCSVVRYHNCSTDLRSCIAFDNAVVKESSFSSWQEIQIADICKYGYIVNSIASTVKRHHNVEKTVQKICFPPSLPWLIKSST